MALREFVDCLKTLRLLDRDTLGLRAEMQFAHGAFWPRCILHMLGDSSSLFSTLACRLVFGVNYSESY